MPLVTALSLISGAAVPKTRSVLQDAEARILEGVSLSQALAHHGPFSSFEIQVIAVGEQSGSLPQSLGNAARLLEGRRVLARKALSSLVYPLIIVIGSIGVVSFLLLYTFPKITPLFRQLNVSLPFSTRLIIAASDFLASYGLFLLAGAAFMAVAFYAGMRRPPARMAWERLLLRIPVLRSLVAAYEVVVICRSMESLIGSGVTLVTALSYLESSSSRHIYRRALTRVTQKVIDGDQFSVCLREFPELFPRPAVEIIATGEMTGTLPAAFSTVADLYELEFDEKTRMLTSLIEPALMVTIGVCVGVIALAILAPIYRLTGSFAGI